MDFQEDFEDKITEDVVEWNLEHPIDFQWREHFKVPFGSKAHLESCFIDQLRWRKESDFIAKIREAMKDLSQEEKKKIRVDKMGRVIVDGEHTDTNPMTEEEVMDAYESISLDDLDKWDKITLDEDGKRKEQ